MHRILKCIIDHGRIYRSDLMKINRIKKDDLDEIIEHLEFVGAIESFKDFKAKRNPTCYRVIDGIVVHDIIETKCAYCGVVLTDNNISDISDKNGYPFCKVCAKRTNAIFGTGKQSATCFGTYFAETALSKVFKDVKRAPYGNPAYDFICNHNKKIDVKAACVGVGKQWEFSINKNKIADYFLLAAFDNRADLNLVHLWLIPGHVLNNLQKAGVGAKTAKWSKYEMPIDKATKCCNDVQHGLESCRWGDLSPSHGADHRVKEERDIWLIPEL